MKVNSDRKRIIGFTVILSPEPFNLIKKHPHFLSWLHIKYGKVWVMPTNLSSSNQVKIGWLLKSHPAYTKYLKTTEDLLARIQKKGVELELSPHSISHQNANEKVMRTNTLKVVTTEEDSQDALDGLIEALTEPQEDFLASLTFNFKLTPFRNNTIERDGITELIARQNTFLHNIVDISVVDCGNGDDLFHDDNKPEGEKDTIRE